VILQREILISPNKDFKIEATCVQIEILIELDMKSIWERRETNLWVPILIPLSRCLDKEVVILNYNLSYSK
jgi:hypothetical protein